MRINRIVSNVATDRFEEAKRFYVETLGLDVLMDLGWIATVGSEQSMSVQISFMQEGGSGTDVPDLSIEVDNLDEALSRVKSGGYPILYGPTDEPWGVRRFYTRDPFGNLINILVHR